MTARFSPMAQLVFDKKGIHPAGLRPDPLLTPNAGSILEVFAHHENIPSAHTLYSRSFESWVNGGLSQFTEFHHLMGDATMLLLVGRNVLLCRPQVRELAYQLACMRNLRQARGEQNPAEADLQDQLNGSVIDVSEFSVNKASIVANLSRHYGLAYRCQPAPPLERFQDLAQGLASAGLLTVPVNGIDFGDLRRRAPFCPQYGFSRGDPIDRYYLRRFIAEIRCQVKGITLEIGGQKQNRKTYGFDQVTEYRTMDICSAEGVDIIADAHDPRVFSEDSFDSIALFNVLEHCERPWVVVENLGKWLRPGGKVFCMVPNAQRIHPAPKDFWRLCPDALQSLFASFRIHQLKTYGNLFSTVASLSGVAIQELTPTDLTQNDPRYPVITCIVAEKTT
jgi:SAM-dependent methyltransferase